MPRTVDDARSGEQELPGDRHTASSGQVEGLSPDLLGRSPVKQMETLSPERLRRAKEAHQGYFRWLRLSRLALAAFFVMAAAFLVWAVPWLPSGLDTSDYTPELAFTIYLLGAATVTGMLALGFRELARRGRESLVVWASVYDEATGLHNRTYLYDRLSLECERAERSGGIFSVIVLQIRTGNSMSGRPSTLPKAALQKVAELIDRRTHAADLVALLSGSELAVLTMGVDQENRGPLLERLRAVVAAGPPGLSDRQAGIDMRGGAATYGVDGKDPGALVQAARTAAILALPPRVQAA